MSKKPTVSHIFARSTLIRLNISGENVIGSGFFYKHNDDFYVVTNLHVIRKSIEEFNNLENEETTKISNFVYPKNIQIFIRPDLKNASLVEVKFLKLFKNRDRRWVVHPNCDVNSESPIPDLVAIPIDINLDSINNQAYSSDDLLPPKVIIQGGDPAIAVGYPEGLYDPTTYFPIMRNALISTPLSVDYKGFPCFLIDARMHSGTSGSPVITQRSITQRTKEGVSLGAGKAWYFIGVHMGPEIPMEMIDEDIKPLDLNVVWKAELIEEMLKHYSK